MSPNFQIGPLTFHIYGLIIALAFFVAWTLIQARAKDYKIPQSLFSETNVFIVLFLAIVFARLYHVFSSLSYYIRHPQQIIAVWNGGIGILGGLLGIFLGVAIITHFKKSLFLKTADLISPSILLAQVIGRFGNYFNQEGFGPPTNLPWGIYIKPINRPDKYFLYSYFHPTFFYEAAIDFVFFLLLIFLAKKFKKPGQIFAFYLIFYSLGRFAVEFERMDTWTVGTVKIAQVITFLALILGLWIFRHTKKGA